MDPARMVKSAVDLWAAGDRAAALKLAEQIVQRLPYQPRANELLSIAHALEGRWGQAAAYIENALKAEPSNPNLHFAMGTVRGNAGDAAASAASMRKALDVAPGFTQAMIPLAMALIELGRSSEAEDVLRRALARQPGWPDAVGAMASLLTDRSQTLEAEQILREAAAANPGQPALLRMLCQTLNYIEGADPAEAKALRDRQGRLLPAAAAARPGAVPNVPDPDRRLRIAYVSPDLRRHSVGYFMESFIGRHDAGAFEVFCYSTSPAEDDTTRRIKAAVPHWRRMHGAPDAALLQQIRSDQIDILIELSGLTGGDRLAAIAPRAAPIQVTYIGCPSSTGVPAIDCRLVDAITDPPGAEVHASERLVRLHGAFLCYRPPDEAPEPAPPPSASGAPMTFGSFNNLAKLSPGTAALWARVVSAVPGARLLLKGKALGDEAARRVVRQRFEALGLAPDRLELVGDIPGLADHLSAYSRIDIALDPFPYNGTTTTCEALWMGVPVLTLRGQLHAGRVGASLLSAAGMPEWIAESPDALVVLASSLASDRSGLTAQRADQRRRIAASRLCDSTAHAGALEAAYREMWRSWCAGR